LGVAVGWLEFGSLAKTVRVALASRGTGVPRNLVVVMGKGLAFLAAAWWIWQSGWLNALIAFMAGFSLTLSLAPFYYLESEIS